MSLFFDRLVPAFDRLLLRIFFREIEIVGAENVPAEGPLLLVSNHGNAFLDPMLVFGFVPRRSRFLAKSTLWEHPVMKHFVRMGRAIPVYRRHDAGVDTSRNAETFARSHEVLAEGGVIALFPEGISHAEPALMPLKTGVARIALEAEERFGPLNIDIVPVGLNFEDREIFRSRVLIQIGEPLPVAAHRADTELREAVRDLTERVESALRTVTLNYESWRQAELLHCAAEVYSRGDVEAPLRGRLAKEFPLKKAFLAGYRELERRDPECVRPVLEATESYDSLLRSLRLEDRHVAASYPKALVARFLARNLAYLLFWRPLAFAGWVLNWLPYTIPGWATRALRLNVDLKATYKLLISMVAFPAFWIGEAIWAGWWKGALLGWSMLLVAPATGYLALTYSETWRALREEARAYLMLKGRKAAAEELKSRRHQVYEEVERLVRSFQGMAAAGTDAPN